MLVAARDRAHTRARAHIGLSSRRTPAGSESGGPRGVSTERLLAARLFGDNL